MSSARVYAPSDLDAVTRIWREVGWIDDDDGARGLGRFLECGDALVADIDGVPECLVHRTPGSMRHSATDLPLSAISAVTTSWIGRKRGFASALTAQAVAEGADAGAAIASLGAFEHGFYDRLGFGTGAYEHVLTFDPRSLVIDLPYRTPVRLDVEDAPEIAALMARRHRGHGAVVLDPVETVASEMLWRSNRFAFGYRDPDDGRLTHYLFGSAKGEHGPYRVAAMGYEEPHQVLELLRLLRELGDQVMAVRMGEPPELQLQELVRNPNRQAVQTTGSDYSTGVEGHAWWQFRINRLAPVVEAHTWAGAPVAFDLSLSDPITDHLPADRDGWRGVGGEYHVTVGVTSTIAEGHRGGDTPSVHASVNAFTRLWFGVMPASSLVLTDGFRAPAALLPRLDEALRLPTPHPGWDY